MPVPFMEVEKPGSFINAGYAGGLGWGLGAAVGAKMAAGDDTLVIALEADVEVGVVSLPVEAEARVMGAEMTFTGKAPAGAGGGGYLDLAPGGVLMAPEVRSPGAVQLAEGAVLRPQPVLEVTAACIAGADRIPELVIGLHNGALYTVGLPGLGPYAG